MIRCWCLLLFLASCASPTPPASIATVPAPVATSAEIATLAECSLTAEAVDRWIAVADDSHSALEAHLEAHAREHGWPSLAMNAGGPDWLDAREIQRCPPSGVERLATAWDLVNGKRAIAVRIAIAIVLDRNGRLDEALAHLDRSLAARAVASEGHEQSEFVDAAASAFNECAARLCERAGRHALALHYAAQWEVDYDCGNFRDYLEGVRREFRARNLRSAGRCDEAAEIARSALEHGDVELDPDARLLCVWLECELGAGRAKTVDEAVAHLCALAPEASQDLREVIQAAARLCAMRRAGVEGCKRGLAELALLDAELAFDVARRLDDDEVLEYGAWFEVATANCAIPSCATCSPPPAIRASRPRCCSPFEPEAGRRPCCFGIGGRRTRFATGCDARSPDGPARYRRTGAPSRARRWEARARFERHRLPERAGLRPARGRGQGARSEHGQAHRRSDRRHVER